MEINKSALHQSKPIEISPETRAFVEQKMPHASDATKKKTMEVMESLKQKVRAAFKLSENLRNRS